MRELPPLDSLSPDAKDALIEALWKELQELRAEVKKPKQKRVRKTSSNSSLPPAKGFKANQQSKNQSSERREGSVGRTGGGRELTPQPDQVVVAHAKVCPQCRAALTPSIQQLRGIYERIELPVIKPVVTRVERYGGECPHCQTSYEAPVPVGLEPGSPFGSTIASIVTYLRYRHSVSYQRMSQLMDEMYGLKISEGAIANLLKAVHECLKTPVNAVIERLRRSRMVCSDETSARVKGQNQWEWVFQNEQVCVHVIRPTRGKAVISEVMDGHRPQVWVSDLFSSQKANPAEHWQVCLAHQLRDCQYAIDAGDERFAPRMKRLFLKAIALHRRREKLADSTLKQYRSRVRGALREILNVEPRVEEGKRLLKRYRNIQEHLFLFFDDETIPPTNNSSEQALRWSVVFRKVNHGFRSDWGAELFAHVRTLVNTAMRQGISAFDAISRALTSTQSDWLFS